MRLRSAAAILLAYLASPVCAAEPTVIPVELQDGNNFTTVRIGGVKLRTIVDTGGWYAIGITSAALTRVHVRFSGTTTARIDGSGDKLEGRDFRVAALLIGGVTFHDLAGFEIRQAPGGDLGGPPPFDAVIGRDFLARYTVVVDYPRRRFELYPAARARAVCGPATATMLPSQDGIMFSTFRTDAGVMNLGWDTGATFSVVQKAVAALRGLPLKDDFYATRRFALEHFEAGDMDLVSMDVFGIPDLDGLIGFNFFEHRRVCFDYARHTVSVRSEARDVRKP